MVGKIDGKKLFVFYFRNEIYCEKIKDETLQSFVFLRIFTFHEI